MVTEMNTARTLNEEEREKIAREIIEQFDEDLKKLAE